MTCLIEIAVPSGDSLVSLWASGNEREIVLWDQRTETQCDCSNVWDARLEIELFRLSEEALCIYAMLARDVLADEYDREEARFKVSLHEASVEWEDLLDELVEHAPSLHEDEFEEARGRMREWVPCPMCGDEIIDFHKPADESLCGFCVEVLRAEV